MFLSENNMAMSQVAEVNRIRNYLLGMHEVRGRKDFDFNGQTFKTAKIILQSIKQIVSFHASYLCGNAVSITGDSDKVKLLQSIYKRGGFSKVDYEIAKSIYTYGNAYEHLWSENGVVKSRVIPNQDGCAIYENGKYVKFIEQYCYNVVTDDVLERVYTESEIVEYCNGNKIASYRNASGLPIHYSSGNMDRTNLFGVGVVADLIPIMNEIEVLLSKMSDSVTTLSMNPLGVATGQRIEGTIDKDLVGSVLNLDDGGTFAWATADLDSDSIKLLLDNLIGQFYTVAQVQSALFGQSNISNVSQTSLELLFNNSDSLAKEISFELQEGFCKRLEMISRMVNVDLMGCNINFNYNRPIDNQSMLEGMKLQYEMGAISLESILRNSPYVVDVERELEQIQKSVVNSENIVVE